MSTAALAVDVGTVRVGLAGSDPSGTVAVPLGMLARRPATRLWSAIAAVVAERQPERLVVGLPRQLDGSEGGAAADARSFAFEAGRHTGLPVDLWDERFTTAAAERSLLAAGERRARRRQHVDTVAATLLLQSWLEAQRLRTRG